MPLIAITPIKIYAELAATPIVLSPIGISADSTPTALSITISTEESTKSIINDKHPNSIVYQPLTIRAIARKSIFLASSIENSKAIEWQKDIIELLKLYTIIVLNPQRNN